MTTLDEHHAAHSSKSPCCAPARPAASSATEPSRTPAGTSRGNRLGGMIELPGGAFLMGTDDGEGFAADGEGPVREVALGAFRLAAAAVTCSQFATFVKATGYVTEAETFGWSYVFADFLPADAPVRGEADGAPWRQAVDGADWGHPEGPGSSVATRQHHPVVHVSWNDAMAFCAWRGLRLPTEAEWEYAARGSLVQKRYPWGDELTPNGQHRCNIWQGEFPVRNTGEDGHLGTAPVKAYRPNGFGLFNMSGNVWEWCSDWFSPDFHLDGPRVDPHGPAGGTSKVVRGGSYLCHASYCNRYRVAARSSNMPDSSTGNIGFRCAADV
jgi:formylglycine-generating enzyme